MVDSPCLFVWWSYWNEIRGAGSGQLGAGLADGGASLLDIVQGRGERQPERARRAVGVAVDDSHAGLAQQIVHPSSPESRRTRLAARRSPGPARRTIRRSPGRGVRGRLGRTGSRNPADPTTLPAPQPG
ncbi:hypothetical protein G6F63_014688 [Rhizopus arrhizus]|nr:hypothetical protein G6F63_014688 [Rhizopus arrhizus]